MALSKLKYSTKVEILAPEFEAKADDKKYNKAARAAIAAGMVKASGYVQRSLGTALDEAMTANTWSWPRDTLRKSGELAGSSRDIVDMGRLYGSQQIKEKFLQSKVVFSIIYNTPYAALVHYGGAIQPYGNPKAATVTVPGRPWITATLQGTHGIEKYDLRTPMQQGFVEEWKRRMEG